MARFTLEELKGLGPAESSPAIQHTTEGVSSTPLERTPPQLSMLQGHKGATNSSDHKSRTVLLGVLDESEQELSPGVSDSEDEGNAAPKPLSISERRKAQNRKFSAW